MADAAARPPAQLGVVAERRLDERAKRAEWRRLALALALAAAAAAAAAALAVVSLRLLRLCRRRRTEEQLACRDDVAR